MTSERAGTGAGAGVIIGRRSRTAVPALAVDRDRGVVAGAGTTVVGVDAVLVLAPAGAVGGLSVVSAGAVGGSSVVSAGVDWGSSVVSVGGGEGGGGLAGGSIVTTVRVV